MKYAIAFVVLLVVFLVFLLIDKNVQKKIKDSFQRTRDKVRQSRESKRNDSQPDKPLYSENQRPVMIDDPDTIPHADNLEFGGEGNFDDGELDDFFGYQESDTNDFLSDDDIFSKDFFDNFFDDNAGPVEPLEEESEDDLKKYTAFGNTSLGTTSTIDVDKYDEPITDDIEIGLDDEKPTLQEMISSLPKEIKVLLLSDVLKNKNDGNET